MIEDLQNRVKLLYELRGFNSSPQTLLLGAVEELGELAMATLLTVTSDFKPSKKKLGPEYDNARDPAREVGDLITYLLAYCNKMGISPTFKWNDYVNENL